MDTTSGAKGDPVLVECRTSITLDDEIFNDVAYHGNNNRSPAILDSTIMSEFNNGDNINQWDRSSYSETEIPSCENELTVSVQNVYKSYEKGKPVLSNLCMNVRKGTIYGLLGSSGSGKTSLLLSIVGMQKYDSGEILLFNKTPKKVPGRRIGFMPQDIALYDQVSVREMIGYYGRLYGMADKDVEEQWLWLVNFLQLPSKFKLIKDLSGGQQRRVSLAITLVHSPDLLILDEPTVGLDPLLRESIWEYLFNMVQTRKTTVIVTTHYIEEARFSNTIGFMRKGRLLVEDEPNTLLQLYQCDLLEQVVVKLCRKDDEVSGRGSTDNGNAVPPEKIVISYREGDCKKSDNEKKAKQSSKLDNYNNVQNLMSSHSQTLKHRSSSPIKSHNYDNQEEEQWNQSTIFGRVRALSTVILLMFMRHPIFLAMVLFLPTIQMLLTLGVIGTHPKGLMFGVVNKDMMPYYDYCFKEDKTFNSFEENVIPYISKEGETTCDFKQLSCRLITELAHTGTLKLTPIKSEDEAREEVVRGNIWGYYSFPTNYSHHLQNLVAEHKFAENETLEGSQVHLTMDMSHYMGSTFAIRESFEAYEKSAMYMASKCGLDPREFSLPFQYRKPVFGRYNVSYHDYVIPIVILTVVFEIPMLVTSILFINDRIDKNRKQGTLNRARVAGLRFKEVMISHFLTQGSVIMGQTAICSFVLYLLYDFQVEGCYALYFFLIVLGGICGESLGLLLGVLFQEEIEALMFGIFIGPILLLYEGVLWPVEGMAPHIRTIAYLSPTTLTIESLRSVIYRGVGLSHGHVWPGILIMTGWIVAIWIVSIAIFIRRHK